jgi:hypothetical protein
MIFRILVPVLICGMILFVIMYIITYFIRTYNNFKKSQSAVNTDYNDLTNESLLRELLNSQNAIRNDLSVIKYCMIFFVVMSISSVTFALIAYVIHLLS